MKRPATSDAGARDAGFSLLELLVVLVIAALAAAVSWPRFRAGVPQGAVQSAALQLAAGLRVARAEARRTATAQTVTLDLDTRTYSSSAQAGSRAFAKGIEMDVTGAGLMWVGERAVQLQFHPSGAASGGEITLRDGQRAARVTVDWLTGATTIDRAP
jgi:general secretion pathway protein H